MTGSLKRAVISGLAFLLVSGCQIGRDLGESWQDFNTIMTFVRAGGSQSSIDRSAAVAVPFATLGFRYGNSPQAIITLSQSHGDRLFWVSRDGLSIATEHGRIVRTSGFPGNLTGGKTTTRDPLALPHAQGWGDYSLHRILDFNEDFGFSHPMECTLRELGPEDITILGSTFTALKFAERCKVPTLKWSFENTHWMDAQTGFLWRTRQWISPAHKKPVELEVLRPATEDPDWQIHSALKTAY